MYSLVHTCISMTIHDLTSKYLAIESVSFIGEDIENHLRNLVDILVYHNNLYYVHAQPVISDSEYDILFSHLSFLEKKFPDYILPDSPSKKVWWRLLSWFEKASHLVPLISLSNSYNAWDLSQRGSQIKKILSKHYQNNTENKNKNKNENEKEEWKEENMGVEFPIEYLVEPKLDGSSLEIIYKSGHYTQAITRWDGTIGEDITQNVTYLQNLPLFVESFSEIDEIRLRWEVVMPKSSFERLNLMQAENDNPLFANPRNAAAGTLRQLDTEVVKSRWLIVFVYDILTLSNVWPGCKKDSEQLERLEQCGLPVYPWKRICTRIDEVISVCEDTRIEKELDQSNSEMDGLVIKINSLDQREILGVTEHHPRRAIAYKFPTKQVSTKLSDITYQVWRTWAITPVAELDPVSLWWVIVRRATLHNFDYIWDRDIRLWDRVRVQRSGEVIPYILWPIPEKRTWKEQKIKLLDQCPSCMSKLIPQESEVALLCENSSCPAKIVWKIQHFVSRNCLDISWLGDSVVETLCEKWVLSSWKDLYDLSDKSQLLRSLPWFWDKKIASINEWISSTRIKPLWRWIHWFWIPHIGKKISQDLSKERVALLEHDSVYSRSLLDYFMDEETLTSIFWLGDQTIRSLWERAKGQKEHWFEEFLKTHDIDFYRDAISQSKPLSFSSWFSTFNWKRFVITWQFEWVTRDQLSQIIEKQWWVTSSSVSSKTDYLLCGEKAGSKLEKALNLWVPVIRLDTFLSMASFTLDDLLGKTEWWENKSINKKTTSTVVDVVQWSLF